MIQSIKQNGIVIDIGKVVWEAGPPPAVKSKVILVVEKKLLLVTSLSGYNISG